MSYVECPKCGHRALSVATQCPHCGLDFLTEPPNRPVPVPEPEVPRLRRLILVGGVLLATVLVLVIVAVVAVVRHHTRSSDGMVPPVAAPVDSALSKPSQPAVEKSTKPVDSARQVAPAPRTDTTHPPPPAPPAAKQPVAEPSASRVDTSRPAPSAPAPAPPPGNELLQRYARMWVNVRNRRRPDATIVRVLKPGEPVLVDSLRQQWYRVLIDGRPVGYVYRGYLTATPP